MVNILINETCTLSLDSKLQLHIYGIYICIYMYKTFGVIMSNTINVGSVLPINDVPGTKYYLVGRCF